MTSLGTSLGTSPGTSPITDVLDPYIAAVTGKKATDIVVLDVRGLTSIADAFILCSGQSSRQVSAIGEFIIKTLKDNKIKPLSAEGLKEGRWVLLDYGDIIIHVFTDSVREFYDIEGLWADAKKIKLAADE
ncbi:MAG: ribosome silencing factor [Thermodesulfobacteriota bacterium]|nr:ribosome silencing factor [Thermodesulfobacteriota bacterium]